MGAEERGRARFAVLGPVRAWAGDTEIDLGPAKQRAVLAMLLLRLGEPVPTARIVDAVWGEEPPANGANVVQKYVAGLRRALEPGRPGVASQLLTLTPAGYVLSRDAGVVDADEVAEVVRAATPSGGPGRPEEAAHRLAGALAQWRGEPLAGLGGPFFAAERHRLEELRATATAALAEAELALGRPEPAVERLRRLVAEQPGRERPRELLMLALYRAGRQVDALAAYRAAREHLVGEFGTEPSAGLQDLHRRMLAGDPGLRPPAPAGVRAVVDEPGPWSSSPEARSARLVPPVPGLRRSRWRVVLRAVGVGAPLLSLGSATWIVFGVLAARRRSVRLLLTAVAYLVAFAVAVVVIGDEEPVSEWRDDLFGVLLLVTMVGGFVHLLWLLLLARVVLGPQGPALNAAQRRELARHLLVTHPDAARSLALGRPDLPRVIDDGGLIDLNSAPYALLARVPGVSAAQAFRIVVDRDARGPFRDLDELVRRELLGPESLARVAAVLVVVPPSTGVVRS